ncbi:ABC transporter ATP-binding protein [uncultured Boseongicola sp.]|jgi:ABC-type sugar transport system ATPase subunit|uniref:ABC transporter ATP-binding protein n=1 Tax=uncultured Boseongicola sp. TaxID=1648499 RepID=UPI0026085864|nr:ABC transporter ATP-binding protein [uncultured Boseongicola sp.]
MPEIVLDRVSRIYGKDVRAVSDLTLEIPDGSFTTLLGPSGCGKTTSLRMIAGLDMPTTGTIRIGDKLVFSRDQGRSLPPAKRGLGLVFQSYALWPHLTVAKNITFGLEVQHIGKTEAARRLEQVATALQIDELLDRYTSELSGGQQQRVAIARVLVMEPSVLLLDEPLSNLDATLRMDMRAELKRLHHDTGATIVYVTHDQLEALTMSTHIALMQGGELQQFAPPLDVYSRPANKFAADFLGNPRINLLEGSIKNGRVRCVGLELALPSGIAKPDNSAVTLGLRAEEIRLHTQPKAGTESARVTAVLPTGSDWYYHVDMNGQTLTVRQNDAPQLQLGSTVHVEAVPDPVKLFSADGLAIALPQNHSEGV